MSLSNPQTNQKKKIIQIFFCALAIACVCGKPLFAYNTYSAPLVAASPAYAAYASPYAAAYTAAAYTAAPVATAAYTAAAPLTAAYTGYPAYAAYSQYVL